MKRALLVLTVPLDGSLMSRKFLIGLFVLFIAGIAEASMDKTARQAMVVFDGVEGPKSVAAPPVKPLAEAPMVIQAKPVVNPLVKAAPKMAASDPFFSIRMKNVSILAAILICTGAGAIFGWVGAVAGLVAGCSLGVFIFCNF